MPFQNNPPVLPVPPRGRQPLNPRPPLSTFEIPSTKDRPVLVTAEVTIPANSSTPANALNLVNPDGEAMLIHEIKFGVAPYDPLLTEEAILGGEYARGQVTGGQVGVELALGDLSFTNGPIPIWLMGLARYLDLEQVVEYPQIAGMTSAQLRNDAFYTWTLKSPLYIPAGKALSVSARNFGVTSGQVKFTIGLSGVTIEDKRRSEVVVPWVTAWQAPGLELGDAKTVFSSETDLYNSHDTDLWIERFTGRLAMSFLPYGSVVDASGNPVPDLNDAGSATFEGDDVLTATMKSSSGMVIVRDPTPFRLVFGSRNRAWQVGARLPPQEFIRVTLQKADGFLDTRQVYDVAEIRCQPQVGMIGWRKVQL